MSKEKRYHSYGGRPTILEILERETGILKEKDAIRLEKRIHLYGHLSSDIDKLQAIFAGIRTRMVTKFGIKPTNKSLSIPEKAVLRSSAQDFDARLLRLKGEIVAKMLDDQYLAHDVMSTPWKQKLSRLSNFSLSVQPRLSRFWPNGIFSSLKTIFGAHRLIKFAVVSIFAVTSVVIYQQNKGFLGLPNSDFLSLAQYPQEMTIALIASHGSVYRNQVLIEKPQLSSSQHTGGEQQLSKTFYSHFFQLEQGDDFQTGENALIQISTVDGSRIFLGPSSKISFDLRYNDNKGLDRIIDLQQGYLYLEIEKQRPGNHTIIQGANIDVKVVGTKFSLARQRLGMDLVLVEGAVAVRMLADAAKQKIINSQGKYMLVVDAGHTDIITTNMAESGLQAQHHRAISLFHSFPQKSEQLIVNVPWQQESPANATTLEAEMSEKVTLGKFENWYIREVFQGMHTRDNLESQTGSHGIVPSVENKKNPDVRQTKGNDTGSNGLQTDAQEKGIQESRFHFPSGKSDHSPNQTRTDKKQIQSNPGQTNSESRERPRLILRTGSDSQAEKPENGHDK